MKVFFVCTDQPNQMQPLETAVNNSYPNDYLKISPGQFFVAVSSGLPKEISDRLGITDGGITSAIVLAVTTYFGRASATMWEWIADRQAKQA